MTYEKFIQNIIDTRGQWSDEVRYSERGCERHHIIPRCMGGEPDKLTWDMHENVIWLYPSEHYTAHKLLALENPTNPGIVFAWNYMHHCISRLNEDDKQITDEEYEKLRFEFSKRQSEIGKPEGFGEKISIANKLRVVSPEIGKKISESKKKNNKEKDRLRLESLVNTIDKDEFINVYYNNDDATIINWCKERFTPFYGRDLKYLLDFWGLRKKTPKEVNDVKIKTMYHNYGIINNFQREDVKNKAKQTKLELYGDENYSNRDKAMETTLLKYGTLNMFHFKKSN